MEKCKRGITLCLAVLVLILLLPIPRASAATIEEQVQEKIRWIIAGIPDDCDTDYEKALWLHDYLCETVTYDLEYGDDKAYTALLYGRADCGGYADAYRRLLLAVGVQNYVIHGSAGGPHAWNVTFLDGQCYYTDVTWDDNTENYGYISHKYFNIPGSQMSKDHRANAWTHSTIRPDYNCEHTKYGYMIPDTEKAGYGSFDNSTTPEEAAKHFKVIKVEGETVTLFCEYRFDGDAEEWKTANSWPIQQALGVFAKVETARTTSYGGFFNFVCTGIDFIPTKSISFAQSTVRLDNSNMCQQLSVNFTPADASYQDVKYTSSDSRIAKVDENGVVRAVSSGTAIITATAVDGKTATCQVIVDHKHDAIRYVPALEATCLSAGYTVHYVCESCGTRFADSKGQNVVSLMDVVIPNTFHGPWLPRHNDDGHWSVCVCGYSHGIIQYHEDENGDGLCDDEDCRYVMDASATRPATKPNQSATQSTIPSTTPETRPSTEAPPASTPPTTESTTPASSTIGTEPSTKPLIPTATVPSTTSAAPPATVQDDLSTIRWILPGLIGVVLVISLIAGIRKRK